MERARPNDSHNVSILQGNPEGKSFPFHDLAEIFNLATEDLERNREEGREICFKAVLGAIEEGQWERINQARKHLSNLSNSFGQSVFTACAERGMVSRIESSFSANS